MVTRFWRSRPARGAAILLALLAAGSLSGAVSVGAGRRATDRWLGIRLGAHPTDWPGRRAAAGPARSPFPWVVAVDYEYLVGPHGGEGGTRYYLGLFGLAVPIRSHVQEQY